MRLASRVPAEGRMFPIDFDFELGSRVDELRQAVREFALRRIAPVARLVPREPRGDNPSPRDQLLHADHPGAARLGADDVDQVPRRLDAS